MRKPIFEIEVDILKHIHQVKISDLFTIKKSFLFLNEIKKRIEQQELFTRQNKDVFKKLSEFILFIEPSPICYEKKLQTLFFRVKEK